MMQPIGSRVRDKVAIITGASSGIGRAVAELFVAEGARLIATDRDEPGLAGLAARGAVCQVLDVTEEQQWRTVVDQTLAALGRLDILVNSAGIVIGGNIETATLDEWRKINAVNAEGTFLGCREAVKAMKASGGGAIVNISSVAGIVGDAQSAAYCASKAAVRLLTKSVALHCARAGYGIRCNSVHPAFTETPMIDALIAKARDPVKLRAGLSRAVPLGRMGRVEEVAAAVLYLASDESSFTTGGELIIDGGLTAQ